MSGQSSQHHISFGCTSQFNWKQPGGGWVRSQGHEVSQGPAICSIGLQLVTPSVLVIGWAIRANHLNFLRFSFLTYGSENKNAYLTDFLIRLKSHKIYSRVCKAWSATKYELQIFSMTLSHLSFSQGMRLSFNNQYWLIIIELLYNLNTQGVCLKTFSKDRYIYLFILISTYMVIYPVNICYFSKQKLNLNLFNYTL